MQTSEHSDFNGGDMMKQTKQEVEKAYEEATTMAWKTYQKEKATAMKAYQKAMKEQ